MKKLNYYHYPHPNNVGDNLTPYILRHFRKDIEFTRVKEDIGNKVIVVGSIMRVIKPGDTIIGAGIMRDTDKFPQAKDCKFLAVRGKLTRDILIKEGGVVPEVYGDPAILMPLIYNPDIKVTHDIGIIPHFVDESVLDEELCKDLAKGKTYKIIDVCQDYESFINDLLTVKHVIGSSLHALILAEAYGLTAEWIMLSNKVLGNGFKFRDYLTGTERCEWQNRGIFPKLKKSVLKKLQAGLIKAIEQL